MGILQARILEWGCHAFLQGIFPIQGSNPGLPHCRQILYRLSHPTSWFHKRWEAWLELWAGWASNQLGDLVPLIIFQQRGEPGSQGDGTGPRSAPGQAQIRQLPHSSSFSEPCPRLVLDLYSACGAKFRHNRASSDQKAKVTDLTGGEFRAALSKLKPSNKLK